MDETITLTRSAFFQILDKLGLPNPDDSGDPNNPFGPFGPGGPVSADLSWVMLNPQLLPPLWLALLADSALTRFGPHPEPWRASSAVHLVVNCAMMQYQLAEVIADPDSEGRTIEMIGNQLREIIDDWCGTGKPRWPWPKPGPHPGTEEVDPLALLLAGREFQRLADTLVENPLQNDFAAAAAQLTEVGLSKLAG